MDGATLSLLNTTSSAAVVSVSTSKDKVLAALESLVEEVNNLASQLATLTERGLNGGERGALASESTVRAISDRLKKITTEPIFGYGENPVYLANLGVSTTKTGGLKINERTFDLAFKDDPQALTSLYSGNPGIPISPGIAKNPATKDVARLTDVEAVKDVSFHVNQGEIFSILGPNGAGKSTTILMLTTLLRVTSGSGTIFGLDVEKEDRNVREKIGIALQDTGLDNLLTGRELFFTTARLWGFSKTDAETRTSELLELVGLEEAADRRVKTYSGGMKRRLDLGLSLVHKPDVLFLDEPTTGLDPGSRRVLWDEIKRLRDGGVTIILTTQYLEEADELADRISIIDNGLVAAEGTPDELKALIGGDVITFTFNSDNDVKKAQQLIENSETEKNQLRVTVENGAEKIPDLLKNLSKNKLEAVSVTANKPSLDDVFLEVTGYRLEGATEEEGLKEEVSENE